jgi:DNA-directed RNA polymerase specialized sigma24 family protein
MNDAAASAKSRLLEQVAPVVRAILVRKSGMSLAEDDQRRDNIDALELFQDVLARLWERLVEATGPVPELRDLKGYAAATTYNVWSDYLRDKYPQRASLKNRLRYFLGHQPRYAIWENAEGELVGGHKKWQLGATMPPSHRVIALREQQDRLPAGSIPRKAMERFVADDWGRLLDALFERLGGPVEIDDLVGVVAALIGLKEDRVESVDEDPGDEDEPAHELADADGRRPDRDFELRSTLTRLWVAIRALKFDYRCAYLLNIPGPGKSRGDIEVFVLHGVATITEIGATLALTEKHYQVLWVDFALEPEDRVELAQLATLDEHFCLLWKYLPIADASIGRVLGLEQQQVINRRMLAMRELARALTAEPHSKGGR